MEILKADNDPRAFRFLTLDSGLEVILVDSSMPREGGTGEPWRDRSPPPSSAAFCVGVGGLNDPPYLPGLAHLTQHLLFPSPPREESFGHFVHQRGGEIHAKTYCDTMVFSFEIREDFPRALKIFCDIFCEPLIKEESIPEEISTIEAEFRAAVASVDKRREMVFTAFLAALGHPMGRNMAGSENSLRNGPESQGINVKDHVVEFVERNFSSLNTRLAVECPLSLDDLENLVRSIFSTFPSNRLPHLTASSFARVPSSEDFHRVIRMASESNQLVLIWPLPQVRYHFRTKPLDILGWLICYQGDGGVVAFLRSKGWISNLVAGNSSSCSENNPVTSFFSIVADLLDEGIAHIFYIVTAILQYLSLIQLELPSIQHAYSDLQAIRSNLLLHRNLPKAEDIARNLFFYGPKYCLVGDRCFLEYDERCVENCLEHLSHRNFCLMLSGRDDQTSGLSLKDPWFLTQYYIQDIPSPWKRAWSRLKSRRSFKLPAPNRFLVATECPSTSSITTSSPFPVCLGKTSRCRTWYKPNEQLKTTFVNLNIVSKNFNISLLSSVMSDLFAQNFFNAFQKQLFDAWAAGFSFKLNSSESGLLIHLNGFSQNFPSLLVKCLEILSSFSISERQLPVLKAQLVMHYRRSLQDAETFAEDLRLSILDKLHYLTSNKLQEIGAVTRELLEDHWNRSRTDLFVQSLIQGNLPGKDAAEIHNLIVGTLKCSGTNEDWPTDGDERFLKLRRGPYVCCVASPSCDTSAVTYHYQCCGIEDGFLLELALSPLLRTLSERDKANGTKLRCQVSPFSGTSGFTISASAPSDKLNRIHASRAIFKAVKMCEDLLRDLDTTQFQELKEFLLSFKLNEKDRFEDEFARNWKEISICKYNFSRHSEAINFLRNLDYKDFKEWLRSHIPFRNYFPRLSAQVLGCEDPVVKDRIQEEGCTRMFYVIEKEIENSLNIVNIQDFRYWISRR